MTEDVLGLENHKIMHSNAETKLLHLCPVQLNIRWYFSSLNLDKLVFLQKKKKSSIINLFLESLGLLK